MTPHLFHCEQRTAGSLISALRECEQHKKVAFDFCGFAPNGIHPCAPHGDLALGFAPLLPEQWPTVEALVKALYGAIHQTFRSPAGTEFTASSGTPLWVANAYQGDGHTVVAGVIELANVYLRTEHMEVWS